MRISDWSSDVCSSDLVTLRREIGENSWLTGVSVGRWRARDSSDALLEGKDAMAAKVSVGEMNRIMREEVPMAGNLGILFESITDGQAVARLPFREDLLRPGGPVTGPAMRAMADGEMDDG